VSQRLKVLVALPQASISPGPRYRVMQYLPFLERAGIDCHVVVMQGERATRASIESAHAGRLWRLGYYGSVVARSQIFVARIVALARSYDRVLVYRMGIPGWALPLLAPLRDRLIYDFDDAISEPEVRTQRVTELLRARLMRNGFTNAIRASGLAITSNEHNARVARRYGGRVSIVPTSVLVSRYEYQDRAHRTTRPVTVGWVGTPSTAAYLPLIEAPLTRAVQQYDARVVLVGAGRNPFANLDAVVRDWSEETEAAALAEFDIGVMPMPDTPWTRGKAALKALQYGASGAPTIASWTPTNEEILGTDAGTLLCRSDAEWQSALTQLLGDAVRRGALGRRGRARVESRFSVEGNAAKLAAAIRAPSAVDA
jgi:glycosyltransferase involved in cell wall biosynthesis